MTANRTADGTTELVVTQQVAAPINDVWAAWTSVEGLARWWWPRWPDTVWHRTASGGADDYRQGWEFVLGNLSDVVNEGAAEGRAERTGPARSG